MTTDDAGYFALERSTTIAADPATVRALLDDFRRWTTWSPWEGSDPDLQRTYGGAATGVGASYAWSGNRKAGAGSMVITESTADRVVLDLVFTKPFKAENVTVFELADTGAGTSVTWRMTGKQNLLARIVGKVVSMDKLVGKDFEKGLAALKAQAEQSNPG